MPLYTVTVPAGRLDRSQKQRIARALTRIHVGVTGAPPEFVHTFFEELPRDDHFVAGEPSDMVVVTGHIRDGRSDVDKQRLLREITQDCAEILDRPIAEVATLIRDVPAKYIFEGGEMLPEPGQEAAWLAARAA